MANYHLEISTVSRNSKHGKKSVTRLASYITGCRLHDDYSKKSYSYERSDVALWKIYVPPDGPKDFYDLQILCDRIEATEVRKDARTAREFKGSLPNELHFCDLVQIVDEFVNMNFVELGLPAIAAIHNGINKADPTRNNPHVHIIVPTRTVGPEGFSNKKYLPHNAREYIKIWRSRFAEAQNHAYARRGLDIMVSHKSLKDQNQGRDPVKYFSRSEYVRNRNEITANREAAKEERLHAKEQSRSVQKIDRGR